MSIDSHSTQVLLSERFADLRHEADREQPVALRDLPACAAQPDFAPGGDSQSDSSSAPDVPPARREPRPYPSPVRS